MTFTAQRTLITVDKYHQMLRARIFGEDDRIELLNGELITMSPIGIPHVTLVNRLNTALVPKVLGRAIVSIQNPIQLGPQSEPQPDVVLFHPRVEAQSESHAQPADIFLVIEVADSSVDYDRNEKTVAYARAGILETWLFVLDDKWLEVYREPSAAGYRVMRRVLPGESIAPQAFPEVVVEVGQMLK